MNCTDPPLTTVRQPIDADGPDGHRAAERPDRRHAGAARRAAVRARARRPRLDGPGARRSLTAVGDSTPAPAPFGDARARSRVINNLLSSSCILSSMRYVAARLRPALPLRDERRTRTHVTDPALADIATPPSRPHRPAVAALDRPPSSRRRPDVVAAARSSTRSTSAASPTANGDGTGDLAGVRARLPYLRDLGVDAIWFTPWYVSPLADGGYDVADYRAIDPAFGTLEEAEALIAEALDLGIRTIVDIVPNHVSDRHPWFQAALAAGPGSPERERFWFRPGRGAGRRRAADRLAVGVQGRPDRGPARRTPTARPASGTSTCSRPSSRTSTGTTPTSVPSTRRSSGSGSTAARPASGSTRRPCSSRTRRCPRSRPTRARAPTRSTTATSCTTSTGAGARSPTAIPASRPRRRGLAPGRRAVRPLPPARRAAHRLQLRLHGPALGRGQPARVDRRDARRACAGRRAGDLGAVEPRRHPAGHPLRPPGLVVRLRPEAVRDADGPRARATPGAGRGPPHGGPARLPVHLPGRRARARRGRRRRSSEIQDPMHARSGGIDPGRDGCRVPLPWAGTAAPFGFSPADAVGLALAQPARPLGRR